jgi:hypothetical protein
MVCGSSLASCLRGWQPCPHPSSSHTYNHTCDCACRYTPPSPCTYCILSQSLFPYSQTRYHPLAQVMQGKLSTTTSAPIFWLAFKTTNPDMRTCGFYVQPSNAKAVLTTFTASAGYALENITLSDASCDRSVTPARLQTLASATFTAALLPKPLLNPMVPAYCTSVFTQPTPNVSSSDNTNCKNWVATTSSLNYNSIKQPANPTCPCESWRHWDTASKGNSGCAVCD